MTEEGAFRRTAWMSLVAFVVPFFVMTAGWRYLGSGDTVPAELLPISILGDGNLAFDEFVHPGRPLPYWFQEVRGRVLSSYPVLPGLLNVPVYAAAGTFGAPLFPNRFRMSLVTAALLTAGSVVFMHRGLLRVCGSARDAALFTFAYFFGTAVWSVAGKGLFQHGPSLFFLTLALLLLLHERPRDTALAGLALGFAVLARPTDLLIALPLAVFAAFHRRRALPGFVALAAVPAALHALYAWQYFGTPFASGQPFGLSLFTGRWTESLSGLLVSPSRGLFVFSPFLLFALPASVACFRRGEPALFRYLVAAAVLELALFSKWGSWWGGHTFGYRLLIELVPLLVLVIARHWRELARLPVARPVFGALLVLSFAANALGACVFPSGFNDDIDVEPWRLWSARDSELVRDARMALARPWVPTLAARADARGSRLGVPSGWWAPELDDASIPAYLEWPRDGAVVRGDLVVAGWAGSGSEPVEVQALLRPDRPALAERRGPRPDVCLVYPRLGDCGRVGFTVEFRGAPGRHRENVLVVELRAPSGKVRRLGPVRFFWNE